MCLHVSFATKEQRAEGQKLRGKEDKIKITENKIFIWQNLKYKTDWIQNINRI
jgi:hypothetical protein